MTPTDDLIAALAWYDQAKQATDQASYHHWQVEQDHEKTKAQINTDVWGDKAYSNDTLRKAEAARRLDTTVLLDAEAKKTAAAAELARAEQALKTYRALVNHYTAELTLEAARIHASIAAMPF